MQELIKKVQENLATSMVKPIFADEVVVETSTKAGKGKGGKVKKEGNISMIFVDMLSQQPVARVVVSPLTAEGLKNTLAKNLENLEKELKSKTIAKKTKITTESARYIG